MCRPHKESLNFITITYIFLCNIFVRAEYIDDPIGPTVKTAVGVIRGVPASDGDYDMFMGIPYARVNISNPFGNSLPYPKFDGIFEANNDSTQCIQIHDQHGLGGSLDCLQLSVYVPNNIKRKDLPVMVYIYGGSLRQGSFTRKYYGPRHLMKYGIIFVIMNYRVGSYGTLCLDIPEASGNQALKDQQSALRWVQHNIEEFGGDPNKVTLTGHSGGSVCVSLHVLHANERLFHQAIMASGSMFYPAEGKNPDNANLFKLSKYFGYETNDVREALYFLTKVEPSKVIQAEREVGYVSMPCREMHFENDTNFLTEFVQKAAIISDASIPMIISNTGYESYYLFEKTPPEYFMNNDLIAKKLTDVFHFNNEELNIAYELVKEFYSDNETMEITKRNFIDFHSEFNFVYPNKRFVDTYLQKGARIYYFIFNYSGGWNFLKNERNLSNTIATHGDELGYIFDISFPYMNHEEPSDEITRHRFLTMLTNFVKYGDPTPETTDLLPYKWKPVTNDTIYYMDIDTTLRLHENPFNRSNVFWSQFYERFKDFENNA